MDLYHTDLGLPAGFRLPNRAVELSYTHHAREAATDDRYGDIPLVPVLNLAHVRTIEVGMEGERVAKVVVRAELDDDFDIVFVLIPCRGPWRVKTVWLNEANDTHKTLNRSRYTIPA